MTIYDYIYDYMTIYDFRLKIKSKSQIYFSSV